MKRLNEIEKGIAELRLFRVVGGRVTRISI
jgi:hypothetical protein